MQNFDWQRLARKGSNVERNQGASPHGVNVGQRIGCRNASKVPRSVDDGGKKIHRLDQSPLAIDTINTGIISGVGADQEIRVMTLS